MTVFWSQAGGKNPSNHVLTDSVFVWILVKPSINLGANSKIPDITAIIRMGENMQVAELQALGWIIVDSIISLSDGA